MLPDRAENILGSRAEIWASSSSLRLEEPSAEQASIFIELLKTRSIEHALTVVATTTDLAEESACLFCKCLKIQFKTISSLFFCF